MIRKICIVFLTISAALCFGQLGLPLTQFSSNPMTYNPAYAGVDNAFSLNLSARKQWTNLPSSPSLVNFDGHAPFENNKHSWGAILQHESWGPLNGNFAYGNYSYKLFFANSSLSLGLQAGVFHSILDWDKIEHVKDPTDPVLGSGHEQYTKFDVNIGAYYWTSRFYFGLSVKHLAPPKLNFEKHIPNSGNWQPNMGTQFLMMSGMAWLLDDDWSVRPEVLVRYVQATPLSVNVGIHGSFQHRYFFGINVETGQKAFSFSVKGFITEQIRLGYSYDIYLGAIRPAQNGSHEISVNYLMKNLWDKKRNPSTFNNPRTHINRR